MRYELLAQVVDELAGLLSDCRVDRVLQGTDGNLYLMVRRRRERRVVLLSPDRRLPRIHLVSGKPAAAGIQPGFCLLLRKHLTGARIIGIAVLHADRLVDLRLSGRDRQLHLLFELTGATTNLILADHAFRIIAVLHPVPVSIEERRTLLPGAVYEPPAVPAAAPRAGGDGPDLVPGDGPDRVNRAVEAWAEELLAQREDREVRGALGSAVRRALARAERKIEAIRFDLGSAGRSDEHRRLGELILANLHLLRRGQEQAVLQDREGRSQDVMLDPAKTPAENAEVRFRAYKKSKAALMVLNARLAEALDEADRLRSAMNGIERAMSPSGLIAIRDRLQSEGLLRDRRQRTARQRPAPGALHHQFEIDGWQVLVGKSAAGNDHLTMQIARPDDLWLHADGMPGSHVLVRNLYRKEVPATVLEQAAGYAAYFSKGRGSTKVPVVYTQARHVHKPKGARPGSVVLRERRTIVVIPLRP